MQNFPYAILGCFHHSLCSPIRPRGVRAALNVLDVVLFEELRKCGRELVALIRSDLKWPTIRPKHVFQHPCFQILSLPARDDVQDHELAKIIHADNNIATTPIGHFQPRRKINAPCFSWMIGSQVAGNGAVPSKDPRVELAS